MSENKKPDSNGLNGAVPVTVVLAMLAGLAFTHLSPYQDERPSNQSLQAHYEVAQDVDARLWQDPFAAVDGASEEAQTEILVIGVNQDRKTLELEARPSAKSPSHEPDQIYKGNKPVARDDITVIAVTLSGGSYQEEVEDRMRRRYAVLSALANQGATPRDEQHIGYFHPMPDMGLQKRVAFEWWSWAESNNKKVLLLWVDESSLLGCPAAKIKDLLLQTIPKNAQTKEIAFHYTVIGPNTSTLLRDMLKDVEAARHKTNVAECPERPSAKATKPELGEINAKPIVYYSAGATASDYRLLKDVLGHAEAGDTISAYLSEQGITLYRTTANDLDMMDIVVNELLLRQVEKTDHVVILSEWDTYYGRTMPNAFKFVWNPYDQEVSETVKIFGYMRGLDGKLPDKGDKPASVAEKKNDSKDKEKSESAALIEFPEGQNQKDYLRRMADNIHDLDQDLKDQGDKKGVSAIGVLGSDVHDKLLILEALRQYFPHKLFFTTDLDAAYFHPAKWRQTHNLLVASAFDLKLRPELQGDIPPFRDSYQTAFFLAAQLALKNGMDNADPILPRLFDETSIPQLFISIDPDADFFHPAKWLQTRKLLEEASAYDPIRDSSYQEWIYFVTQMMLKDGAVNPSQIKNPPRLFEIGRSRQVSLPTNTKTYTDTVSEKYRDDSNKPKCSSSNWSQCFVNMIGKLHAYSRRFQNKQDHPPIWPARDDKVLLTDDKWCSWANMLACNTVQPRIFATSQLYWSKLGIFVVVFLIMIPPLVNWRVRKSNWYPNCVALVLLLFFLFMPLWNTYMFQNDVEPFYWLEGMSIWPSELLRLTIIPFVIGFLIWVNKRLKTMQDKLQAQRGSEIDPSFALPKEPEKLGWREVLFIGNWKEDNRALKALPDDLWRRYLGYFKFPGSLLRVLLHVLVFLLATVFFMNLGDLPNVPARGDLPKWVNMGIIILAVFSTLFLITWVVENARLCERLITHLSAKPSRWNLKAKNWAIHEKKIAPECVEDWLDINLVTQLTETMQPLIFGPVVCIALLVSARSPLIDNWDLPWRLEIVLLAMLLYAISTEVFLQRGANNARKKAIDQLTMKISGQRSQNPYNEVVIKRIEDQIERIRDLRDGAFSPWYEWPLLQSFGGLGTLWVALQYFAGVWGNGTL
ncbi:MAG: hypothetical protein PHO08_05510 [Methylococcales bacterium]|nr:hypothetical protein [Methylococcales bacterium]